MDNYKFVNMFYEYLNEYSDNAEIIGELKMFLNYGWCNINGNDSDQREFISWMAENGASLKAIKAAVNLFD